MNIKIKIDVTKINKERLYKGEKGTYLNAVMIEKKTEFSDFFIVEDISKEEREAGKHGAILGNGSYMQPRPSATESGITDVTPEQPVDGSDLPF